MPILGHGPPGGLADWAMAPRGGWRITPPGRDGARSAGVCQGARGPGKGGSGGAGLGYAGGTGVRQPGGPVARTGRGHLQEMFPLDHAAVRAVLVGGQWMAAGAPAGAGGSGPRGWPGRRAARIWRIAAGSAMVAITRTRPPQRGHANTSSAKARRMRAAHGQLR
jgi:hypothetical protein